MASRFDKFAPPRTRRRRAYSLIEVLITILIIQIISSMIMVNVSNVQTSERLSRAAEQMILALRYSRILAMSTGQAAGVKFDQTANTVSVFQGSSNSVVADSLMPNGSYLIDLSNNMELAGVKISGALISNQATTPFVVTYGTLGGTTNNGYVTLTEGGLTRTVTIPLVGDPKVQ